MSLGARRGLTVSREKLLQVSIAQTEEKGYKQRYNELLEQHASLNQECGFSNELLKQAQVAAAKSADVATELRAQCDMEKKENVKLRLERAKAGDYAATSGLRAENARLKGALQAMEKRLTELIEKLDEQEVEIQNYKEMRVILDLTPDQDVSLEPEEERVSATSDKTTSFSG